MAPPIGMNISAHAAGSMGITVEMDPSPLFLVAAFHKLGVDIRSFRVPLERSIKEVAAPSMNQNFFAQGRPDQWAELAAQTVSQKEAAGYSAAASRPLIRTQDLMQTAGDWKIWNIDGVEGTAIMELPADVWYGKVHQEGSNEGGIGYVTAFKVRRTGKRVEVMHGVQGFVPQRMWALLQDDDIDKIEEVFDKWMEERLLGNIFHR